MDPNNAWKKTEANKEILFSGETSHMHKSKEKKMVQKEKQSLETRKGW